MSRRPSVDTLPGLDIEGLGLGPLRLEDLVDREALREMAVSVERLFGVPIRVLSGSGALLADVSAQAALCGAVVEHTDGRKACDGMVGGVKALVPDAPVDRTCFTGAVYRVVPILYDRRPIGRVVLGPYLPPEITEVPASLLSVDSRLDAKRLAVMMPTLPRANRELVQRIAEHVTAVLDVILFSGHKSLLTSKMHLASVRESYRELTEQKEKLELAYERLKEVDRLKSNFLATVSHELRTPLTSIMGYSEMLAEGIAGPLSADQAEFIQTIRTKSDHLLALIMSLLDLSKLESGTAPIRRAELMIRRVLDDAVSTLTPAAAKKGVTLRAVAPDDLVVIGDLDRLRQIFVNLTDNAIKFTSQGGTVTLSAVAVDDEPSDEPGLVLVAPLRNLVEIRVSDTGVGIAEGERSKVFDPFYQIDQSSTREHGGAGLGLAIVKRLVEGHHGTIHIERNEPYGSVFVVRLPVVRGSVPPPPPRKSLPPALA